MHMTQINRKKNDTKSKPSKYTPNVYGNHLIEINRNNDKMQPKVQPTEHEQPLIDFCKLFNLHCF